MDESVRKYLRQIGQKGGSTITEAKSEAARRNGALGGRPRLSERLDQFGIPLEEMARLGTEDGYDFRVYTEPLGNPSFHILGADFEIVVTIRDLKILEVKKPSKSKHKFKKGEPLAGALLKSTLSLMSKKVPHTEMTRKQFLIVTWNENNPQYVIDPKYLRW